MTWVDFVLLGVIGISVLVSLFRGLVREVMALAVWVIAFWLAFAFADEGQGFLAAAVELPSARFAIAFAAIFLSALLAGAIINYLIGQLIDKTGLSGTDRVFGMVFGAARGVVLVTLVVFLAGLTPLPRDPWWQASRLLPTFEGLAQWAADYLEQEFRPNFSADPLLELIGDQSSGDNTPPEPAET